MSTYNEMKHKLSAENQGALIVGGVKAVFLYVQAKDDKINLARLDFHMEDGRIEPKMLVNVPKENAGKN
tara:strand:- start:131 stop:337 length:207 start_codon:yes stop_codon:yes gene_type:complete